MGLLAGKVHSGAGSALSAGGRPRLLRLDGPKHADMLVFGDCGAFAYHKAEKPPYTPEDMLAFYDDAGFTHGCSVDHIIFEFEEQHTVGLGGGNGEAKRRFDITQENAREFLRAAQPLANRFTPMGVIQGWSPGSMAEAARRLCAMGYRYLAVGGTVPLKTPQIKSCLRAIRDAIPPEACLHVLGFAKADDIADFRPFRITSFDTTSPLLRAFKDAKSNYYVRRADGRMDYYTAIRIPQAIENPKLQRLAKRGERRQEDLLHLERRALHALRAYDREEVGLAEALDAVMAYDVPALLEEPGGTVSPRKVTELRSRYERTLHDRPWKACGCTVCRQASIEVVIFRASNRNKRRGMHNLSVFKTLVDDLDNWRRPPPMTKLIFSAVMARQSPQDTVLSFAASASEVLRFATIERVARDADGQLSGFQRPQIAAHIREIRDYLETPEAVLPNPIVVAFTSGVEVEQGPDGVCRVTVDVAAGPPGLIVDGQQRITALSQVEGKDFQIFVSALVCRDEAELRRQSVLINNTRPLPKTLIYELLPTVPGGLPRRLSERSIAADLTARMNRLEPLEGRIRQHTSPTGVISDIAVQKFFLNSLSDGAMRLLIAKDNGVELCLGLAQEFFKAVAYVFLRRLGGPDAEDLPASARRGHRRHGLRHGPPAPIRRRAYLAGLRGRHELPRGQGGVDLG
ncbi:tRNA-guanine transglycosylase DpdA [Dankookia sp. P2]|uniref:tRNA-guanine transglycosylase DpdA n=1 Tax=Dankookia sp. P2 TaxID=3423955 RepID=UPI003D66A8C8